MSSLDAILRPRSIAVIGASRRSNTIGWQILDNLLQVGFTGPLYPVNPKASSIHSIPAYPTIADVPGPVDLALIVVPSQYVNEVARQCVDAGVRGLVAVSAGFKEIGGEGVKRERELVSIVRGAGARMVGPNCLGVINNDPAYALNATFVPVRPPLGHVGFVSQSGAMGASILDYAKSLNIGVSMFVSIGNKADVSGNDLLDYWKDDPKTQVVLMYLESFGNPAKFVEIGREMTRTKPIFIVKSGRTGAGARAAASHTGALAGTDLVTDALIAQAGALRAETVEELFDLAMSFANQPLPEGNRVAIVTNAGGPGIMAADACEANGLDVVRLTEKTEELLRSKLPEEASVKNPVDLIASASAESYEFALHSVFNDPNVDAAIAAFVPPLGTQTKDVAAAIVRVNEQHPEKPLLAVLMGREGLPAGLAELHDASIPAYIFPESAARALGAMWRYRCIASRPAGSVCAFEADDDAVEAVINGTLDAWRTKLSEPDAMRVLEAYGIPVAPWSFVPNEDVSTLPASAAEAAEELGFPVALKIVSPEVSHKTDVGGVALDLESAEDVERALLTMLEEVTKRTGSKPRLDGVMLQQMVGGGGIETIVGLTRVPRVGAVLMFGMGGIYVEALRDVVMRLSPLVDVDADRMIREVKLFSLLEGVRGQAPRDLGALQEAILRISQLAERHPRIVEMDINPLVSFEKGCVAIDARVQIVARDP
jgi:acetate---CoA ligase (ADP-forming)